MFLLLVYFFIKILIARKNDLKGNKTESNERGKVRVIIGVTSFLYTKNTSLTRQSRMVLTYFILILVCLLNPITRIRFIL